MEGPHDLGRIVEKLMSNDAFLLKRSNEDPGRSLRFDLEPV
ncbi:MAG: hypothetical protein ACRDD5_05865 [Silvania sp.]